MPQAIGINAAELSATPERTDDTAMIE